MPEEELLELEDELLELDEELLELEDELLEEPPGLGSGSGVSPPPQATKLPIINAEQP